MSSLHSPPDSCYFCDGPTPCSCNETPEALEARALDYYYDMAVGDE